MVLIVLAGSGGAKSDWKDGTSGCHGSFEGDEEQYVNLVNIRSWDS